MHRVREALTFGLTWSPRSPSGTCCTMRMPTIAVVEIAAADGAVPDGAAAMESSE